MHTDCPAPLENGHILPWIRAWLTMKQEKLFVHTADNSLVSVLGNWLLERDLSRKCLDILVRKLWLGIEDGRRTLKLLSVSKAQVYKL